MLAKTRNPVKNSSTRVTMIRTLWGPVQVGAFIRQATLSAAEEILDGRRKDTL